MTRGEKKQIREKEKSMDLIIKSNSKLFGYKSVMGIPYKISNNFIFEIIIIVNKNVMIKINCKPILLDEIFWEVFDMLEEAKKQPQSFHIKGAFVAGSVKIDNFEFDYNKPEEAGKIFKEIMEYVNKIIENYCKIIYDIKTFQKSIINDPNQYLNHILLEIINKNYKAALEKINGCIKNNKRGGFSDYKTGKNIIEYAKEYCEKRI